MILGTHTITILSAVDVTDAYGNSTPDWANATEVDVDGCSVQPVEGAEVTVGRETVVSRWRMWAPEDTALESVNRVRYAGDDYEVDGEVQRWDFPPMSHVSALLRRGVNL